MFRYLFTTAQFLLSHMSDAAACFALLSPGFVGFFSFFGFGGLVIVFRIVFLSPDAFVRAIGFPYEL